MTNFEFCALINKTGQKAIPWSVHSMGYETCVGVELEGKNPFEVVGDLILGAQQEYYPSVGIDVIHIIRKTELFITTASLVMYWPKVQWPNYKKAE